LSGAEVVIELISRRRLRYDRYMPQLPDSPTCPADDDDARATMAGPALMAIAQQLKWRLLVLFGSTAIGEKGRDIDLAVIPDSVPDLLRQGQWQALLETHFSPRAVDLLLLTPATSPVTRFEVFRAGRCLFEAAPGLFERERDRAFFLFADSEWFRRQQREALRGGPA
jgi:predicted nucleotidyltransferase